MRCPLSADVWYPAPAKLNLFLHVLGRRPDGLHELQTAFQFLEFGDELKFQLRDDGAVRRSGDLIGDDDLIVQAARLLQPRAAAGAGVEICLHKRIPLGGGLGGGSSDAATTLLVLNRLWGLQLSLDELAVLGCSLGADVPVFVHGHAAFAEGVGELLQPLQLEEPWYLLVDPGCPVSTARVFGDAGLTRHTPRTRITDFVAGRGRFVNDCTPVVRRLFPPVAEALDWLDGHSRASLSGTGATVFATFASRQAAQSVCAQLPDSWAGVLARGANKSPLHAALGHQDAVDDSPGGPAKN